VILDRKEIRDFKVSRGSLAKLGCKAQLVILGLRVTLVVLAV
tara:strand:+ start:800 stop:925 length:126 start_codon:yes stop_codon:yes gene_type:complete